MSQDDDRISRAVDAGLSCAVPLARHDAITMAHGGGGRLAGELLRDLFLPAFDHAALRQLGDCAVLNGISGQLALTTDSYVIQPLFFPGGSIGSLAVHGTLNDLAMRGARPLYLSVAFILEEGLAIDDLKRIVADMAAAARAAEVAIVTGDTKVVERGHGDKCYINVSGVGEIPTGLQIGPQQARAGDRILLSGTVGDHGMAIMAARAGLEFTPPLVSDSAPLHQLVARMLDCCSTIHVMRDPTRGGLAATLNEIAAASHCGIVVDAAKVPIRPAVQSACDILGLDPWLVANEGKLVAIVPPQHAATLISEMRKLPVAAEATDIGEVTADHPGIVTARTLYGTHRIVSLPWGEQLPRIC